MKTINILLVAALCFFLFSCLGDDQPTKVKPTIQDSIEVVTDTMSIEIRYSCFNIANWDTILYIFDNNKDFSDFLMKDKYNFPRCDTYSFPAVDFNNYTLLARKTITAYWKDYPKYKATVYKNNLERKFIYHLDCTFIDDSVAKDFSGGSDMHWLLIPKVPADYEVVFDSTVVIVWR